MTDQGPRPSSPSISAAGSEEFLWEVQEILAERTSLTGENEYLVVWKTSWVPVSNMMHDGPEMRRFKDSPKCKFVSPAGNLQLAFQPGSSLAGDFDTATIEAERFRAQQRAAAERATQARNQTPSGAAKRPLNIETGTGNH